MIEMKEKMIKLAINMFGLTEKPENAGYLLEDGSMLNFKQDSYSHGRDTDHSEISSVIMEFFGYIGNNESIDKFQLITNAIRMHQTIRLKRNSLYIYLNIDQKITSIQWRKLRRIHQDFTNECIIYDIISRREGRFKDLKADYAESGYPNRDVGKIRLEFNKLKEKMRR